MCHDSTLSRFLQTVLLLALLAMVGVATPAGAAELSGLKVEGQRFELDDPKGAVRGILLKPEGKGPFPAILISHGLGGNADRFGLPKAREWVGWGYVCIAPDYTHSAPQGDRAAFGASRENVRRALRCLDVLESLPEVDPKKLCAYGNSMGAFLTIGLAADAPGRLAAAAITAGGIVETGEAAAPSRARAGSIATPFCILHGSADTTVPPIRARLFETLLKEKIVPHEFQLFEGVGHNLHSSRFEEVNARIRAWFQRFATPRGG